jgi:predicted metal-dependent peptidase
MCISTTQQNISLGNNMSKAQEALDKTKVHLMMKQGAIFLSSVSMQLKHEISTEVDTAATNGKYVKYNPEFFINLSKEQRLGLMAHELGHVIFMHMARRGDRKPDVWNVAGDYVINNYLISNNFVLPENGLVDPKFNGWSTEQVYEHLLANPKDMPENMPNDIEYGELSEEEKEQLTNTVMKAVQAAQLADDAGSIPSEIARKIQDLINPKLSWKDLLYRFVDSKTKQDYTWTKPNRRYLPDWYLPSLYSDQIENITVAIDTSGSVSDEMLQEILSEIEYINQTVKPNSMTIMDCDSKIHNIHKVTEYDSVLDLTFTGSGGTSFHPIFKYCKDNPTNLLIYFTDLHATQITEEPDYPVLWICYSNHEPAPIGETIYVN